MNQAQLFALLQQAHALCGHTDYVVIGSLSVLGLALNKAIPEDMVVSVDIDSYTLRDPDRVFDLVGALGEGSAYHHAHGYYLDGVSPRLPTLPNGWEGRMIAVQHPPLQVWFLEPSDAAVSKYARGEPRDLRWIRAGIAHGLISLPVVEQRLRSTHFISDSEQAQVQRLVQADQQWFADVVAQRPSSAATRAPNPRPIRVQRPR
jgi:hypothetical protein